MTKTEMPQYCNALACFEIGSHLHIFVKRRVHARCTSFGVIHLGSVSDADVFTFNDLRLCINCFSGVCVLERPRSRVLLSCKRWSLLLVALFLAVCSRKDDMLYFVSKWIF